MPKTKIERYTDTKKRYLIKSIDAGSVAEEPGLEPGDWAMTIDGQEPEDISDYQYHISSEAILVVVMKANGEKWELETENDYEDLGIILENGLMSEYRSCRNKCIFCFIDQMPEGMRKTLYFKDDDFRLSFLQGNYVTLINMSGKDIERIIRSKLAPISISVQTINPKLRCKIFYNRFAREALKKTDTLYEAEIPVNGQIVLCKGVNDGDELERSIWDLSNHIPCMESVSVVLVRLSKFWDGLYPLEPIMAEGAGWTIDIIEKQQKKIYEEHGIHFIRTSDEFYILANRLPPEEEWYDGYIQLENGVRMLRPLETEVMKALAQLEGDNPEEEIPMATGALAYAFIEQHLSSIREKLPNRTIHPYKIINELFGASIIVAGLITGQDLISQLKGKNLGGRLLLPICMSRSGEEAFLDDVTLDEVKTALQVSVNIVRSSGQDFVTAVLSPEEDISLIYEGYEPKWISKV